MSSKKRKSLQENKENKSTPSTPKRTKKSLAGSVVLKDNNLTQTPETDSSLLKAQHEPVARCKEATIPQQSKLDIDLEDNSHLDALKTIKTLISEVRPSGSYSVGGEASELPLSTELNVKNFGDVSTPLVASQAKELLKLCTQAPYGLKYKTLVDKKVRDTLQLNPNEFTIQNKEWNQQLKQLVDRVSDQLGCIGKVSAKLYKLLIYKKGGHFKKHRDTEKEKGMFATLIVQLPSVYTGGQLVVYDSADKKGAGKTTFDFGQASGKSATSIQYACHYADLEHEILEVTSGYRMVLIYNLSWQSSGNRHLSLPSAPPVGTNQLLTALLEFNKNSKNPLALFLSHKYTIESFQTHGVNALKGVDIERYNLLKHVNERLPDDKKLELYLTSLHLQVNYNDLAADCDGWPWNTKSFYSSDSSQDSDCPAVQAKRKNKTDRWEEMEGEREITFGDVLVIHDGTRYRDTLDRLSCGDFTEFIDPNSIEQTMDWDDLKAWGNDREIEKSGPTGNEGSTKTTIYNKYILVFWPKPADLFEQNVLFNLAEAFKLHLSSYKLDDRDKCLYKFKMLFKRLKHYVDKEEYCRLGDSLISQLINVLIELEQKELLKYFVAHLLKGLSYGEKVKRGLVQLVHKFGFGEFREALEALLEPFNIKEVHINLKFVKELFESKQFEMARLLYNKSVQPLLVNKRLFAEFKPDRFEYLEEKKHALLHLARTILLFNQEQDFQKYSRMIIESLNSEALKKLIDMFKLEIERFAAVAPIAEIIKFYMKDLENKIATYSVEFVPSAYTTSYQRGKAKKIHEEQLEMAKKLQVDLDEMKKLIAKFSIN